MHGATLLTVVAAVIPRGGRPSIVVVGLGAVYAAVGTWGLAGVEAAGKRSLVGVYVAVMGAFFYALMLFGGGATWIAAMPLVSHAVLLGSWRHGAAVGAGVIVTTWVVAPLPELTTAAAVAGGQGALCVFVIAVSVIVKREVAWRRRAEDLAAQLRLANAALELHALHQAELSVTAERNRMAREVHDGVGHALTAIHVQIEAARALLETNPTATRARLARAQQLAHQGLQDVRQAVSMLRTPEADTPGLVDAVRALCEVEGAEPLAVRLSVEGTPRSLTAATRHTLMRTVQEALTNVRRHARATEVSVDLTFGEDALRLAIVDDGVGASSEAPGYGLIGMRERIHLLGGVLEFGPAPFRGFAVRIEVPL